MNAPENIKPINDAHLALLNSKDALCVDAVAAATGLKKREAAKQLKQLAGLGLIEPEFRAGGVPFYRLIAAPASEISDVAEVGDMNAVELGDSEGSEADAPAAFTEAQREEFTLLGLIADIRAAAGDPTGKLMQDELVQHIAAVVKERDDLRARLDAVTQQSIADTDALTAQIEHLTAELQALRTSNANAINEADRLRAELAAERQAREALQEQAGDEAVDVKDAAVGYLVRVPKRAPLLRRKPESARAAALSAVRAGAARAEVLAVVPVGTARRGAEWRAK